MLLMNQEHYTCAVKQYSDMVYRIALNYCKNTEDAEDIMQNTFLKLYQTGKEFQDAEHEKRWLIRVTLNECHSLFRSPWRRNRQEIEAHELEKHLVWEDPGHSAVYEAVMDLPVKYRTVVYLYYYEEYKAGEIAEILSIKETTVQTRLMRARQKLQNQLEQEGNYAETGY